MSIWMFIIPAKASWISTSSTAPDPSDWTSPEASSTTCGELSSSNSVDPSFSSTSSSPDPSSTEVVVEVAVDIVDRTFGSHDQLVFELVKIQLVTFAVSHASVRNGLCWWHFS